MRRLFRWLAGIVSVAALAKLVASRRHGHGAEQQPPVEPDPADELRRKLAEVRAAAPEATAPAEPAATDATEAAEPEVRETEGLSIEERRAAIHARAQEAIDAMKETGP